MNVCDPLPQPEDAGYGEYSFPTTRLFLETRAHTSSNLEQMLKEVLQLAPPVVRSGQRRVLKTCEFGGYTIPQGWDVLYQISETHQDANIYTQPDRFDPQRFAPDRAEDKPPFSHIAFGGMRECLGKEFARLEMKLFAALLIRYYDWTVLPGQDLARVVLPFSLPQDGLKVKFWRQQGE